MNAPEVDRESIFSGCFFIYSTSSEGAAMIDIWFWLIPYQEAGLLNSEKQTKVLLTGSWVSNQNGDMKIGPVAS